MRIEFSPLIAFDLENIASYIASDNPRRAKSFVEEIDREFLRIGRNPSIFRSRPEIGVDARSATIGRYVILFRVRDEVVQIRRVVHGARDLAKLYV